MSIAYGLRAEYEGTANLDGQDVPVFGGGLLALDGGESLDVAEALRAGDGRIVVDDTDAALILRLDAYPALKRVAAEGSVPTVGRYDRSSVSDLRAELRLRDLPAGGSRDELVARLEAADHPTAEATAEAQAGAADEGRAGSTTTDGPEA